MFNYKKVARLEHELKSAEERIYKRDKDLEYWNDICCSKDRSMQTFILAVQNIYPDLFREYIGGLQSCQSMLDITTLNLEAANKQKQEKEKITTIVREILAESKEKPPMVVYPRITKVKK